MLCLCMFCVYYRNKIKGKGRYVGEILRLCELKKRQRKKETQDGGCDVMLFAREANGTG